MNVSDIKECGDPNNSLVTFAWDLTTQCQYRCTYCYAHSMLTQKFDPKLHNIYKTVFSKLKLAKLNNFCIELLGGEPTLHPHFYEIISECFSLKNCKNIMVVTNLARPINFYKKFNIQQFNGLQFDVSFHPEYIKNIDHWCYKLKQLNDCKYFSTMVNINLVDDDKYIELYKTLIEYCISNSIEIGLNILFSIDNYVSKYSIEFLNMFKKYDLYITSYKNKIKFVDKLDNTFLYTHSDIYLNKLNLFKGFNCRPKLWKISVTGEIINVCTGKYLNITGTNINECVQCPQNVCNIEVAHEFHKTAHGEPLPLN